MIMDTNKISFDKAVVNLLNGESSFFSCEFEDTSTVFTIGDCAFSLNLTFLKKDKNCKYEILGNKEVPLYSAAGTVIFDFDDAERIINAYNEGVNEFFNYNTDNVCLKDLDCEEVY